MGAAAPASGVCIRCRRGARVDPPRRPVAALGGGDGAVTVLLWIAGATLAGGAPGDTGEIPGPSWVSNPVARHVACPVEVNMPTSCTLAAYEESELPVEYFIKTLPKEGLLYETSPNYRSDGSDPKHSPDPIGPHLLPFRVSDPLNRLIYVPPYNVWAPEGQWASFEYVVSAQPPAPTAGDPLPPKITSEVGLAVLTNSEGAIAGATFDLADDFSGWSISGNIPGKTAGGLKHQAFVWGGLSHYVYGVDEVMYMNFENGMDRTKWYFEASPHFNKREMAAAYGGKLRFTVQKLYGNFTQQNDPLDWITIECSSCNTGRGLRVVRFVDDKFYWDGDERNIEVELLPTAGWMKDPLNTAGTFRHATECEIGAVLTDVSRVAILGDFTRGGEGVALDNVKIVAAPPSEQPKFPVACQQGCVCRHATHLKRPQCC